MATLWERTPTEAREIIRAADPELADMLRHLEMGNPYRRPSRSVLVAQVSITMDREGCGITRAVQIVAADRGVALQTVWNSLHAARGGKRRVPLPRS